MWKWSAVILFLAAFQLAESRSPSYPYPYFSSSDDITFSSYGPGISTPFEVPGEIIDGIRVEDILETVGQAWNADRLMDGAELGCDEFESVLTSLVQRTTEPEIVHTVCDAIRNSEIGELCNDIWDRIIGYYIGDYPSISLIPRIIRCQEDIDDYGGGTYNFHFSYGFFGDFNSTYADDLYPAFVEAEHAAMADVRALYDFCSEDGKGVEKINNILFAIMDWLGPSFFNSFYSTELDPYSICSIGRFILSLSPYDYTAQLLEIEKYPLADILEYLRTHDICDKSDDVGVELLKDLLVEFSDTNEDDFCEYVSEKQTREEYLRKAATILQNVMLIYQDEQRCNNFFSLLAPLDEESVHARYIGFDLSDTSERRDFCQQVISAFSPDSSFVPSPYRLPPDLDINDWEPFSTPGEFLPGLTFINMLEIEGATFRAETIIDGVGTYCTVFEEFIADIVDEETFDIASLCDLVKSGNLEALEGKCQALIVPEYYPSDHPVGLKPLYLEPLPIYVIRQLTGISDISKEEICTAADVFMSAQKSLGDIVESVLDILIAEALPPLDSVCQNWKKAVCSLTPYCPEPETSDTLTTETPFFRIHYYLSSPEEIARANAQFDHILSEVESLISITTDFIDREALCETISRGIDPASGRAVPEIVQELRARLVGFLTDVGRCSRSVDTALGLISDLDVDDIFLTGENRNLVYQLTGFSSSEELCEAISEDFSEGPPGVGVTDSNGKLVATYDVFMKIAVYLKRNVPFSF